MNRCSNIFLLFWFILMIQVTDVMGKSDPHGLKLLFMIAVTSLDKPGVKELACSSKAEALWKQLA